jgi:hypothetical protein
MAKANFRFELNPSAEAAILAIGLAYLKTGVAPRIVDRMKTLSPVDTGRMRDSIEATVGIDEVDRTPCLNIGPTATDEGFPYPLVVEFEEPFIRPALDGGL